MVFEITFCSPSDQISEQFMNRNLKLFINDSTCTHSSSTFKSIERYLSCVEISCSIKFLYFQNIWDMATISSTSIRNEGKEVYNVQLISNDTYAQPKF